MSVQLFQGDCLDIMPTLVAGSIDLILCDPPYGTTACAWDSVIPFVPMWREVRRLLRKDGAAVFTAQQPFTSALVMSNAKGFHQALMWQKNKASGHLNAKKRHLTGHEDILVFSDGVPTYNAQMWHSRPASAARRTKFTPVYGAQVSTDYAGGQTERFPTSVLDFPVVNNDGSNGGRFHSSQKPVALMDYFIRTYSNEGETVLDFTMGSGSTGVACILAGRQFIGIENDPDIFPIAQQRISTEGGLFGGNA